MSISRKVRNLEIQNKYLFKILMKSLHVCPNCNASALEKTKQGIKPCTKCKSKGYLTYKELIREK